MRRVKEILGFMFLLPIAGVTSPSKSLLDTVVCVATTGGSTSGELSFEINNVFGTSWTIYPQCFYNDQLSAQCDVDTSTEVVPAYGSTGRVVSWSLASGDTSAVITLYLGTLGKLAVDVPSGLARPEGNPGNPYLCPE